jgi:hypothetical protein
MPEKRRVYLPLLTKYVTRNGSWLVYNKRAFQNRFANIKSKIDMPTKALAQGKGMALWSAGKDEKKKKRETKQTREIVPC